MPKAGGTTARGYGHRDHVVPKRQLMAALIDGTPCPLPEYCGGEPMIHPGRCPYGPCFWCTLERDHSVPIALGGVASPGRLAHAQCNRRAGSALGNQRRWHNRRPQRQPW